MRLYAALFCLLFATACSGDDETDRDSEDAGRSASDRGAPDATPLSELDANRGGADDTFSPDAGTTGDAAGPGGSDTTAPPTGPCDADNLDDAIACQVAANDAYVAAFCDCFTEVGFDGDRAACEAEQPDASAFEPPPCVRAAMLEQEAAATTNSLCYAAAARELAACIAVCPPDEAAFNACFDTVGAAFDDCDARVPPTLSAAIDACDDVAPPVEPPSSVGEASTQLARQRDAYVAQYCSCYAGSEFGDTATCVSALSSRYDPGLRPCEQDLFATLPDEALPFLACLRETFTITESACLECPAVGSVDYEICADASFDINFCFTQSAPALQDGLIACSS